MGILEVWKLGMGSRSEGDAQRAGGGGGRGDEEG